MKIRPSGYEPDELPDIKIAARIFSEIGEIDRFNSAKKLAEFATPYTWAVQRVIGIILFHAIKDYESFMTRNEKKENPLE
ncbi:hypothetical protein J7E67_28525 [Bacillus sp. ISL-46]|nr:hypothetical protein [Bacillus sp. ISL-46]